MATLDIFNNDAFSAASLADALENVPYLPSMLGDIGIFAERPVRTTTVWIEQRGGALELIQTDQRGSPLKQRVRDLRSGLNLEIPRLAQGDTIYAHEIQNIRAFGSETELMQVQQEVAYRYTGPTGIMRNIELTWENMRLGAIQGIVLDADGSTLYNFFTEFNVAAPAEIDFDLDNATPAAGVLRRKADDLKRAMVRAGGGAFLPSTRIVALVGDAFWNDLIAHSEIRQTYLNQAAASELRTGTAWSQFDFGGITWINYRGTDDNSTVTIPTDKAKFFPVGAPGVFQVAYAPGESFEVANTLGRPLYPMIIRDAERNFWVKVELYSYPMFYCTRPGMLMSGRRT